jgi:hypothetical protein
MMIIPSILDCYLQTNYLSCRASCALPKDTKITS